LRKAAGGAVVMVRLPAMVFGGERSPGRRVGFRPLRALLVAVELEEVVGGGA